MINPIRPNLFNMIIVKYQGKKHTEDFLKFSTHRV